MQAQPDFSTETKILLREWRQERAYRVVYAMSRIGFAIAFLASVVDVYFHVPPLVLFGDLILFAGFFTSIYFSNPKHQNHLVAWSSLYIAVWAACTTSLATTGGLESPFNGSYWALLYLTGLLVQVNFRAITVTGFIVANILVWMLLEKFFPRSFGGQPSLAFTLLINALVCAALFFFVSEVMKTEKQLGQELLRRHRELNRTREDLSRNEEANAAKSTFLANISHELRTPLGAILGYAELMQAPDLDWTQKEKFAETIHRNGLQLSRLVDDLLDLSKIEAGKIELEPTEFKIKSAITEVIDLFQVTAQRKNIAIEATFQDPLPESLVSDPLRFKQILRNIIGNAIKFTEKGHVRIVTSLVVAGPARSILQIEIEDTGCGLSAEEQKRIFKSFTQGDASVSRRFGGTGLGLSLSKNLSQILGGSLFLAWSQKDVGSCFVFQLPLTEIQPQPVKITENTMHFFTGA